MSWRRLRSPLLRVTSASRDSTLSTNGHQVPTMVRFDMDHIEAEKPVHGQTGAGHKVSDLQQAGPWNQGSANKR